MFPGIDPSQMDPKMIAELSQVMRELSPDQLGRMQTLMHNMMGGFDVKRDMEEFERSLPSTFREKIAGIMLRSGVPIPTPGGVTRDEPANELAAEAVGDSFSVHEARLTVLKGVASGAVTPEDAERLLFPEA